MLKPGSGLYSRAANRARFPGASALLVCALTLPAQVVLGADAPDVACHARIILALVQAMPPPPDDKWVHDLAAANGVELRYVRAITPSLYVFRMIAVNSTGGCEAAIERLRGDARLRSAQIDWRRQHESG